MKRKASFGFILLFLLYLGCKSSLFGVCLSAESFVEKTSIPPCHQTAKADQTDKESCDCPIVLESLQTVSDSPVPVGKPLETVVVAHRNLSFPSSFLVHNPKQIHGIETQTKLPPHFPTRTIRLLI